MFSYPTTSHEYHETDVFSENALLSGFDEVRRDRDVGGTCTLRVLGGTLTLGGT